MRYSGSLCALALRLDKMMASMIIVRRMAYFFFVRNIVCVSCHPSWLSRARHISPVAELNSQMWFCESTVAQNVVAVLTKPSGRLMRLSFFHVMPPSAL